MTRADFILDKGNLKDHLANEKDSKRIDDLLDLYAADHLTKQQMDNEVNTMLTYLEATQKVEEAKKNGASRLDFITNPGTIKEKIVIQKSIEAEQKRIEDIRKFLKEAKARNEMEKQQVVEVERQRVNAMERRRMADEFREVVSRVTNEDVSFNWSGPSAGPTLNTYSDDRFLENLWNQNTPRRR